MKWKKFTDEMPSSRLIIIRAVNLESKMQAHTSDVRRPYDVSPKKYNPNYYEIKTPYNLNWVELDENFKQEFEWLNPFEDRIISQNPLK